jgi:transcription elongation factor Elf1
MHLQTQTSSIQCPYCGEIIDIVVDLSVAQQSYTEDCAVCCRPIELSIEVVSSEISVIAKRDDE